MNLLPGACPSKGEHASQNTAGRQVLWKLLSVLIVISLLLVLPFAEASADSFEDNPPVWEPLLWGGKIKLDELRRPDAVTPDSQSARPAELESAGTPSGTAGASKHHEAQAQPDENGAAPQNRVVVKPVHAPRHLAEPHLSVLFKQASSSLPLYCRNPFRELLVKNIQPLYESPRLPGEGVWDATDMPTDENGWPVMYRTSYRPSIEYPNAIVHMLLFDMRRIRMKLYIGSGEPGAPRGASKVEPDMVSRLLAITNGLWKQRHSGGAGAIYQGEVLRPMVQGMATLVTYKDNSVDILEWNDGIPISIIQDARQLRHLIVKDGHVVTSVVKHGRQVDSEIGLGFLLSENYQEAPYYGWGGYWNQGPRHTSGSEWFIATRSAFGIRPDGNLVFAAGYHISTKDLARALVLAGCVRALHGDANPHNVVGNIYFVGTDGQINKKEKLSPEQSTYTLDRYVKSSYTSDFYAFSGNPAVRRPCEAPASRSHCSRLDGSRADAGVGGDQCRRLCRKLDPVAGDLFYAQAACRRAPVHQRRDH